MRRIQEEFFPEEASSGEYRFYYGDDSNDASGGANGSDSEADSNAFRTRSPRD